jgi:hypothetical protein
LTSSERAKLYRARKAGKDVPPALVLDPLAELREVYREWQNGIPTRNMDQKLLNALQKALGEKQ